MPNNKDQLQKEILAKVKEGVKPSDLKKNQGRNPVTNIPLAPPLPKEQKEITSQPKPKTRTNSKGSVRK